jgi:hypothetical protein
VDVSKEEWAAWKLDPTTRKVFTLMMKRREDLKEEWANGNFTAETEHGTKYLDAAALGAVKAIGGFLDLDEVTLNGEMSNE